LKDYTLNIYKSIKFKDATILKKAVLIEYDEEEDEYTEFLILGGFLFYDSILDT